MKITMNTIRITITLTALLLSALYIKAQNTHQENINQGIRPETPPSPQAVAFNRLGDYQVNNNYGAPDINIPLFEIDFHGYKIPLTLHYEATPMKSGYNYDVTGFGWTLSGNSCVSRTIKDRADEVAFYNFSTPFTLDSFQDKSGKALMYTNYADELDNLNYQYDTYNIVLPSGRTIPFFMYAQDQKMKYKLLDSDSKVRISCTYTPNTSIDAFTVTDENGVIYSFTKPDKGTNGFDNDPNADRNVAWLLTSIDIPSKGIITYSYTDLQDINTYILEEPVLRVSRLVSQMDGGNLGKKFFVSSPPQQKCPRYRMRFLKSITYGPTVIDFNYSQDGQHMSEIVVSDDNETIRKYTLNISGSLLTSLTISGNDDKDRLVYSLDYWHKTLDNNSTLVRHTDYWGNLCFSNSNKDLGNFNMFFNNEEDGRMYLSYNDIKTLLSYDNLAQLIENKDGDPYYYYKLKLQSTTDGDSRKPTPPEYHGVLRRITYPNGGCTEFTFENHRFPTATAADGDFIFDRRSQRIIEGGGFRIKSIVNKKVDGTIASEDHYRYGFRIGDIIRRNFPLPLPDSLNINTFSFNDFSNQHIGCGEAVVDPNLLTFMTFSYYTDNIDPIRDNREFQKMVLGMESKFKDIINPQGTGTWWDAYFSANTFRSLLGGRRPVVYPEITVYHGDPDKTGESISKTVYKYDIYDVHHDGSSYYLLPINRTCEPDTAYFERIYYDFFSNAPALMSNDEKAAQRHQLKSRSDYSLNNDSKTWNLISEEEYSYNEESMQIDGGWIFNSCQSRERRSGYGEKPWLHDKSLSDFYKESTQYYGRYTISGKVTTTLNKGVARSDDNKHIEKYSYLYPGVLSQKDYTNLYDRIRKEYGHSIDQMDSYTYISEEDEDSYADLENGDSLVLALETMKSRNMLASLSCIETFTSIPESIKLSGSKIHYKFYGNYILPYRLYESNGDEYEESIEVRSYDQFANPTEIIDLKTGNHTVYLWDTYGRYMTAMIEGATWSQVKSATSQMSSTAPSWTRYASMKVSLPGARIQTWDYKPLIGVSSHTDINGQTIRYEYDGLGRLTSEKRMVNGTTPETIRKYEYNYRN